MNFSSRIVKIKLQFFSSFDVHGPPEIHPRTLKSPWGSVDPRLGMVALQSVLTSKIMKVVFRIQIKRADKDQSSVFFRSVAKDMECRNGAQILN